MVCVHAAASQTLSLPSPPTEITSPTRRADWLLQHFWDNGQAPDSLAVPAFLRLCQLGSDSIACESLTSLVESSFDDLDRYSTLIYMLEIYLGDTASPYRDDRLMEKVLDCIINSSLPEVYKVRPRDQLASLVRNKVGSKAENLTFTDLKGARQRLSDYDGRKRIVVFAAGDCEDCTHFRTRLQDADLPDYLIIWLYMRSPKDSPSPQGWITGTVDEDAAYSAHWLPAIYILDADGSVLHRELTPESFLSSL